MVNEAARLLFTRRQPLFTQKQSFSSLPRRNAMKPGQLHQFQEALLACPAIARRATADEVVSLRCRFIALVKPLISFACEVAASGGRMCYLYSAALPLNFSTSKPIAAEPLPSGISDFASALRLRSV